MSGMSDFLEVEVRKHLLRSGSWTKPAAIYVALHTANPTDAGGGAEVSGNAYARVLHGPDDAKWSAPDATGGISTNVGDITFPSPSPNAWGVITHVGLWDAVTGGNLLGHGALATPKTVNGGDAAPKFVAGSLTVTFA